MIAAEALRAYYDKHIERYARATDRLCRELDQLIKDLGQSYGLGKGEISGDAKSFESLYGKACRDKYAHITAPEECFDVIGDIARARVVFPTLDDCERCLDLLQHQDVIVIENSKTENFTIEPSETGYRAIHLVARVDATFEGVTMAVPCELQVKTFLQDAWGYYTHADFYKGGQVPPLVATLMRELSDLLHYTDKQANLLLGEVAASKAAPLDVAASEEAYQSDPSGSTAPSKGSGTTTGS